MRGGTSRCPNMHTYMLSIHTYTQASQSEPLHRERAFEKPSTGRGFLKHWACMYVCWACMYVCILNYRPRGWVQFLTKNVQYLNDNSIFWDLWGGVLPDALTCIHTCLAYIHTHKLRNQNPSTGRGLLKNPPQGEGFWNIEHVCMYVGHVCMFVY